MDNTLPEIDKAKMAIVLFNMTTPILRRKVVQMPRTNNMFGTREDNDVYINRRITEIFTFEPKYAMLKNIVQNTPYRPDCNGYMRLARSGVIKYVP